MCCSALNHSPQLVWINPRDKLLEEQYETWISQRVDAILTGEIPDPLHFDSDE